MLLLILGLILFFGSHSLGMAAPRWCATTRARLGEGPWKAGYGLVSLLGLVLIVIGYGDARSVADPIVLWQSPVWLRHVVLLLMLPAFPLLFAAYLPGRIQAAAKHPMLAAVKLWAFAHLLANGTLADLLLFGGFLAWAVADRISMKRRTPSPVHGAPPGKYNDLIAIGLGLAVYVLFLLWLHRALFGVAPVG